ncbi:MFS transporter [Streptomyces blattellae]|uniref:MFS transporter n=1 Tax=Streptomyces blattellae TaxID=2569855 RepID=UPI0012B96E8C|nr:MFS transporter [Streptomyces blattellae]
MISLRRPRRRVSPAFSLFWAARTISLTGDGLVNVALVFAVVSLGGSAADIGTVLGVSMVVRVALTLVGGVLADRLPRRRMLLVSDLAQASVQFTMAFLLLGGAARMWMLLTAAVAYGAVSAVYRPALTGIVPEIVGKGRTDELRRANAMLGMSQSASRVAGPLLAGVLVAVAGPGWVYAIDGATFLVSAVCLARLRLPRTRTTDVRRAMWTELAAGWREVISRRWYVTGLLVQSAYNLASAPLYVLGPLLVGGASAWGAVSAAGAVGAVAGAVLAARWVPNRPLSAGHLLLVFGSAPLLALAAGAAAPVVGLAAGLGMVGTAYVNTVWATTVQSLIPHDLMSRVSSYGGLVTLLSLPAGYALAGQLAQTAGSTAVLVGAAALLVLVAVPTAFLRSIRAVGQPTPVQERLSQSG